MKVTGKVKVEAKTGNRNVRICSREDELKPFHTRGTRKRQGRKSREKRASVNSKEGRGKQIAVSYRSR